jgi:DNA topoisomerase III
MRLVVAEKPSVARDIARVLGIPARGDGAFRGPSDVVTWCIGHLVELEEPAAYDPAWKRWRLETLPMLPQAFKLRPSARTLAQWRVVRDLLRAREFDEVVNACDAGREGELIFRWCCELAGARPKRVRRLWVSSLTDEALRTGFAKLRAGAELDPLAEAARCRAQADWVVGMNATRALTVRAGAGANLLSVGRVQTPTLALVVQRDAAIAAFVPERYDEVEGTFTTSSGEAFPAIYTLDGKSRLTPDDAAAIVARDAGAPARVETLERTLEREPPPLLFDLTTLQKTANRRWSWSARHTLDVAQALYEKQKLVSYPRTDSRHLPEELRPELGGIFAALGSYAPFVPTPPVGRLPRVFDDRKVGDHHAIIPTPKVAPPRLAGDEQKLYDMVARRFLAVFQPDAEIERTVVTVAVGAIPDRYVAKGKIRRRAGWQDVAGLEIEDKFLPPLVEGETVEGSYAVLIKQTEPPRRFNEATLLAAMESAGQAVDDEELRRAMKDCGLGTPATRASTLETLLSRGYLVRQGKSLLATPLGIELIAAIPVPSLTSAELTGSWEARLARMARGEEPAAGFLADLAEYVRGFVGAIRGAAPARSAVVTTSAAPIGACPKCRGAVKEKFKTFACEACDFQLWKRIAGREISAELAAVLLRARRSRPLPGFRSKAGKRFEAALVLTDQGEVKLDFGDGVAPPSPAAPPPPPRPAVPDALCPKCQQGKLVAGRAAWGCARWREGCRLVVPYEIAGEKVTPAQLAALLTKQVTRRGKHGRLRLDLTSDPPVVVHES